MIKHIVIIRVYLAMAMKADLRDENLGVCMHHKLGIASTESFNIFFYKMFYKMIYF